MNPSAPTLLAIDTAADVCSVALTHASTITVRAETVGHRHSERVLPMALALLADAGITLADCDALAFGAGPGAFTGLRIACGVVQGLAYGADKPVIAIGNLEALAAAALRQCPDKDSVLCANDARMHEIYWAVYRRERTGLIEVCPPSLATATALAGQIERWVPDTIAGDADLASLPAASALPPRLDLRATAADIAECALRHWAVGQTIEAARAAPLYVRNHVALTIDERRARAEPAR